MLVAAAVGERHFCGVGAQVQADNLPGTIDGLHRLLADLERHVADVRRRLEPVAGLGDRRSADDLARQLYRVRRVRDRMFDGLNLFGEPAWDMLLDLYIAHAADRRVSVSSACVGAAVPSTTGLRWVQALCDLGLVERRADPADARRVFVALSDAGAARMTSALQAIGTRIGDAEA